MDRRRRNEQHKTEADEHRQTQQTQEIDRRNEQTQQTQTKQHRRRRDGQHEMDNTRWTTGDGRKEGERSSVGNELTSRRGLME